jgi:hypothetical protein
MRHKQLGHCSDCRWWKGSDVRKLTVDGELDEIGTCFVFPPLLRSDYPDGHDWERPRTRATDGCGQLELRYDDPVTEATE